MSQLPERWHSKISQPVCAQKDGFKLSCWCSVIYMRHFCYTFLFDFNKKTWISFSTIHYSAIEWFNSIWVYRTEEYHQPDGVFFLNICPHLADDALGNSVYRR